jgi:hypothetical protein
MSRTSQATTLATLIACLLTGMLLITSSAAAGVATVYQCRTPTGAADTDLIDAASNYGIVVQLQRCSTDGARILHTGGPGTTSVLGDVKFSFVAPGSTTFVGGALSRQMYNYTYVTSSDQQTDSWGYGYTLTDSRNEYLERCAHSGGTPIIGDCSPASSVFTPGVYSLMGADSVALPAAGTTSYTLTVGCAMAGRCYNHYANPGLHRISAALRVADESAPGDLEVTGPLATNNPIHPGDVEVSISASDSGGLGVYRAAFLVDNQVVDRGVFSDNGGKCADVDPSNADPYEFASGHPCPQVAPTKTFQPSNLPEGAHNLKVQVEDAAGNSVLALNRNVTIDLVPAPSSTGAPEVTGTTQQGRTLIADPGTWDVHGGSPVSFGYAWERCDAAGNGCAAVPGASSSLYDVGAGDVGKRLRVNVTASNSEGQTGATSTTTPVIAASPSSNTDGSDPPDAPGTNQNGTGNGNGNPNGLPGVEDTLGPDLRPAGAPNGVNATERVVLSAFESTTERRHVRVKYGRPVTVSGRLLAPGGLPVSGARVEVLTQERRPGAVMRHQVDVLTRDDGRFVYTAPPGASRIIRLGYRARVGDTTFARTTDVDVRVVASVAFKLSRKRLRNGQTLRYVGRLRGPGNGRRFVEVQVRNGRSWQIVCSVRTDAKGAFACAHRFRRTYRSTTYAFRARVRKQTGLAYEAGASSWRRARVRP